MRRILALIGLTFHAALTPTSLRAQPAATPDALRDQIEAMRPAKHIWRAIDWKTCPLEALKAARGQKKPIIAWVFLGVPTDERC
jgi:hypothetical protein